LEELKANMAEAISLIQESIIEEARLKHEQVIEVSV
jgi:urease gamma subunit